ncbi:MAG: TIGR04086 family membrane protein [Oscillospiraceae bacterium]|nr:TIGR04086 family membrane protein [Oscillospiraceae bacterium]
MTARNLKIEAPTSRESIRPIAVSAVCGIIVCALLMLVMSIVITTQDVPHSAIEPMAVFAVSAGALAAGYLCARAMRSGGLVHGGACGLVITLIVLIAGLSAGNSLGVPALFRIIFIMLSSMMGGVIGVNTRRRKK